MGACVPLSEQLGVIKDAGFDMTFTDWSRNTDMGKLANDASRLSLVYHSLHAPFGGMDDIWEDENGELAEKMLSDIFACTDDCERFGIPLMICHTIIGMERHTPGRLGLPRIARAVEYAAKKGVYIAFENTEGEEYLDAVLSEFGSCDNVGFCFDSGHEMCYNHSRDMLGRYGKYLISTHLNDNTGMSGNELTWLDDSHLLPFDGSADWEGIASRLHAAHYSGVLTFELTTKSKPGRTANDCYAALPFREYVKEAYERAVKFRRIFSGDLS